MNLSSECSCPVLNRGCWRLHRLTSAAGEDVAHPVAVVQREITMSAIAAAVTAVVERRDVLSADAQSAPVAPLNVDLTRTAHGL